MEVEVGILSLRVSIVPSSFDQNKEIPDSDPQELDVELVLLDCLQIGPLV